MISETFNVALIASDKTKHSGIIHREYQSMACIIDFESNDPCAQTKVTQTIFPAAVPA